MVDTGVNQAEGASAPSGAPAVPLADGRFVTLAIAAHDDVGALLRGLEVRGARPVALLDAVRCGPLGSGTSAALAEVVASLGARAHEASVPVIGGEVVFDADHRGTPSVVLLAVGIGSRIEGGPGVGPDVLGGRDAARPDWIDALNADAAERLPRASSGAELGDQVLQLAGSSALCDRSPLTDRFNRYAGGDTVLAHPEDAGLLRLAPDCAESPGLDGRQPRSSLPTAPVPSAHSPGIAVALDHNPRYCLLNPYLGAQLALSEAHRNVACTGAQPVAATASVTTGAEHDPAVGWRLAEAGLGLADAAVALGVPVGGVELDPDPTQAEAHPAPVVGVWGVIDDVGRRTPMGFGYAGDAVLLLGSTREELSGSAWAEAVHRHLGGMPPMPDLAAEKSLAAVLVAAASDRLVTSAHDLSEGGLAQALVESSLRHGLGVSLTLPEGDPTVWLFSESPARALVSLSGQHYAAFTALCAEHGVPVERLGEVLDQPFIEVHGQFSLDLHALRAPWEAPLRHAVGAR